LFWENVYIWSGLGRRVNFPVGLFNDKVVAGKMRLFGEEMRLFGEGKGK